jgi:hypothetical protein
MCDTHETSYKQKTIIMRTRKFFIGILAIVAVLLVSSCENSLFDQKENDYGILPENFKVDIPSSLSNDLKSATLKSTAADTLNGNIIYWYLNAYIAVGEGAADIVEAIMWHLSVYKIENVISLSYTSKDDNRVKNLDVIADVEFEGRHWEYGLTITDAESEVNADGGIGMQVFWNKSPIEGIAIFKPYNLDRNKNVNATEAMGSIEYSEKGTGDYEAYMIVEIAGLPVAASQTYAVETMKMFVGKKGDVIDVIGNSNHPNARFNIYDTDTKGFNWAFVASGNKSSDVAVAEVGLPLSSADIATRSAILEDNSIKKVLTREMTNYVVAAYASYGITLQPDEIANYITPYLKNADAPGYFNSNGFVKGGVAPNGGYSELETRIKSLVPYNPVEISNLQIDFNY